MCYSPWGCKDLDMTERLNCTELMFLYACFLESFCHRWALNFVKGFLCIYWDNRMFFIFQFVNVGYHTDWFANIEESLHSWDKTHLVMMYDIFNMLLDSVRILLRIFASMFISVIGLYFSFCVWHLCLVLLLGWWWPHRMSFRVYLPLQFSGRVWAG